MKNLAPVFGLAFLAITTTLHGRVGEDQSELTARLGSVRQISKHYVTTQGQIVELGKALFFQPDGWLVQCDLIGPVCAQISYNKKGEWTEEQKQSLLSSNAQEGEWREVSDSNKMIRKWTGSTGGYAVWKFTGSMVITSPTYIEAKAALEKKITEKAQKTPEF